MLLWRALFLLMLFAAFNRGVARAAVLDIAAGVGLAEALAHAAPGDIIRLAPGVHPGPAVINVPRLTIEGMPGEGAPNAIIAGNGKDNVITIKAADTVLRRLVIRGSGLSLIDKNSGIFLDRSADRAKIEGNVLEDNLIAIYLDGPHDALVRNNRIQGLRKLRVSERGPAVSLWNTPGSQILDNDIRSGRDGVFSVTSEQNTVRGNRFHDLRFAVHFMYTNDSEVSDNISEGNDVGYVLMFSDRLSVHRNISDADREYGLLFNYANESVIEGNVVRNSEKCVFIYDANKNRFFNNWFQGCRIGVHFTAGSERNQLFGNAFIDNERQVMYVGTRFLDWGAGGRGNYWSDNPAFDLSGKGISAIIYRPNDIADQVLWRAPAAKLLFNSPAVQILRWAQAAFPALHPGGVIDSAPLMSPPHPAALSRIAPASSKANGL
jgi:nitrous oxidase accessory protein